VDGVVVVNDDREDRRLIYTFVGWALLIVWQVYWLLEIVERFRTTTTPLQLPYFFLFVVMVLIPLAIYLFFCRRFRLFGDLPFFSPAVATLGRFAVMRSLLLGRHVAGPR